MQLGTIRNTPKLFEINWKNMNKQSLKENDYIRLHIFINFKTYNLIVKVKKDAYTYHFEQLHGYHLQ